MNKKKIPLQIPNKKINYSPQYRNLIPGVNIEFNYVDQRVEKINAIGFVVSTPVLVFANNTLTATCETEGASMFYTTDGSMPTVESTLYTSPVPIEDAVSFRFVAVKNGMVNSEEADISVYPELSSPILSFDYRTGEITLENPNTVGSIYYTTDGSTPSSENGTLYEESFVLTEASTVKAVVVSNSYSSDIISSSYQNTDLQDAPSGRNWNENRDTVAVQSSTPGASIFHTTDGSTPTYLSSPGRIVSTTIFESLMTVKFIAIAEGFLPSSIITTTVGYGNLPNPEISYNKDTDYVTITQSSPYPPAVGTLIKTYYTTDGSTPTLQNGTLYSGPFQASGAEIIKAFSYYQVGQNSSGVSALSLTTNYLCFEAKEAGSSLQVYCYRSSEQSSKPTMEYSTDTVTWNELDLSNGYSPLLSFANIGDKIFFRGDSGGNGYGDALGGYTKFIATGLLEVTGDVNTLIDREGGDIQLPFAAFPSLFEGNVDTLIIKVVLPSTVPSMMCYANMFKGNSLMEVAPIIPFKNTGSASWCLSGIFQDCSSLRDVTVYLESIGGMAPPMMIDTQDWLSGVSEHGVLHCPSTLVLAEGASGLPSGWTRVDI